MSYVPNTDADRAAMMEAIGISSVDQLFEDIPEQFRKPPLNLPPALWEGGVRKALQQLADRNANLTRYACFLGAGAYRHFIPAVVGFVTSRSEFWPGTMSSCVAGLNVYSRPFLSRNGWWYS